MPIAVPDKHRLNNTTFHLTLSADVTELPDGQLFSMHIRNVSIFGDKGTPAEQMKQLARRSEEVVELLWKTCLSNLDTNRRLKLVKASAAKTALKAGELIRFEKH